MNAQHPFVSTSQFRWLAAFLIVASPIHAAELRLDAQALFLRSVTQDLCLSEDGTAIELETGELIEDDGPAAGYSYQPNEESLSADMRIKKELLIPNPRAKKAFLLVGPGGDLQASINGTPCALQPQGRTGKYWSAYSFAPGALRPGKNDVILGGTGTVWIARDDEFAAGSLVRPKHPNRSAKSLDGGQTWRYDRLGVSNDLDGEYYVRIFLEHHHPRGSLTLPVIDLGNLEGKPVGMPVTAVGPVHISVKADIRTPGQLSVRVRTGTTYVPGKQTWSTWQGLGSGGSLARPAGRYLQIAVELATTDPLQTPSLKEVMVRVDTQPANDWTSKLQVVDARNEEIVRTSIPFAYEHFDHPRLTALRERYKLDEVAKGAQTEFELITRLARWSAAQWERGHLARGYPPWDALEILQKGADNTIVGGFCLQYNLVFLQACESFGLPGRVLSLSSGDGDSTIRGGHEVVEIWSNDYKKWVYVDGNAAWYFVDQKTRTPLSLLDLRQRQIAAFRSKPAPETAVVKLEETRYRWQGLTGWPPFLEIRLIPRSNFLEQKSPLPLNQGMRGWFWTSHCVWTDRQVPASLLYGNRISKRGNFEWSLNQAHIVLEATERPGELRIHLDTETASFDTFLAAQDGDERKSVPAMFLWKLHQGRNRLEVRPRNKSERVGIASLIILDYRS